MTIRECYEILGLPLNSASEEVKQAYRKLAKIWHPDRFNNTPDRQKEAEVKFKKIVEAYETLKEYQPNKSSWKNEVSFSTEIRQKVTKPESHYWQGTKYAENEQYQEAIQEFSTAIRLNPNYIEAHQ